MAITSVGYAGTITDDNWRRMATAAVGSLYGVDDYASWRVTPGVGDRATRVAVGGGFGLGVRDVSDAVVTLNHAAVPSGQRWDLIVAHRDWSTETTTFAIIQGTEAKALPTRADGFGTTNDQPIALARFAAGQTTVQEIIDLRCIPGDGGILAFDDLARSYLTRVGTSVRIGGTVWDRVVGPLETPIWISSETADTGWLTVELGAGWAAATGYPVLVRGVGSLVELRGAPYAKTLEANVFNMGVIPSTLRPSGALFLGGYHSGYGGGNWGELFISTSGVIQVPATYYSGSLGVNGVLPVHGMWLRG